MITVPVSVSVLGQHFISNQGHSLTLPSLYFHSRNAGIIRIYTALAGHLVLNALYSLCAFLVYAILWPSMCSYPAFSPRPISGLPTTTTVIVATTAALLLDTHLQLP